MSLKHLQLNPSSLKWTGDAQESRMPLNKDSHWPLRVLCVPSFRLRTVVRDGIRLRTVVRGGTRTPHSESVTAHGGLAPAMKRKPSDDAGADGDTVRQVGDWRGAKVPVRDGHSNYTCPRCGKSHVGSQFKYVNWYDQWMYLCLTCRQCLSCNSCWSLES